MFGVQLAYSEYTSHVLRTEYGIHLGCLAGSLSRCHEQYSVGTFDHRVARPPVRQRAPSAAHEFIICLQENKTRLLLRTIVQISS